MTVKSSFLFLFLLMPFMAFSHDIPKIENDDLKNGIVVDLREPEYEDGVLATEKGGVITGPNVRIQALSIRYIRKEVEGQPTMSIEASGDLIVEFGEYVFVGEELFYDFIKKEGFICEGRTSVPPWSFGGEKIELLSDGSYLIYNGFLTTSENVNPEWDIFAKKVHVCEDHSIDAENIQFRVVRFPILWISSLRTNLDTIFDSPIRFRFRFGGRQGPRVGFTYEIFSWYRWKTFVRFDYSFSRGPGGGIETYYHSPDYRTEFQSINYIAKDSSLIHPNTNVRYRFEGFFKQQLDHDKVEVLLTWDKISDSDIPSSYYDRDFDFETSRRTQLLVRRQEENWISNFYTRVRVNSFQTVNQELPSFSFNYRPITIGCTGAIFENWVRASYLDFKYSEHLNHVKDYDSTRFEYRPRFYRPIPIGPFTFTPELSAVSILYGNSPEKHSEWLLLGIAGYEIRTQLYRLYGPYKHIFQPYTGYHYYSYPSSSPKDHYIFDIDDGWYYLNQMTVGTKHVLLFKNNEGCLFRPFVFDIYAHAFFNNDHIKPTVPKIYARFVFWSLHTLKQVVDVAWDLRHNDLSYFNFRLEWTACRDLAVAAEYRHRNPFCWRKADPTSFFLESFRSENSLLHSALSDRRDTVLLHGFYRFHPNWACEISTRQGWNRKHEPRYSEYEIDLLTTIQTAWHLKFSFQHRENDNRFAVYLNVGLASPRDPCEENICYYD